MCAACLLTLAVAGEDEEPSHDSGEEPLLPEAAYRVLTILARDQQGTTYLAEQEQPRRLVTLQVVRLQQAFDPVREQEFRERTRALRRLSHPAIQPVLDARRTPAGDGCVVCPYVKGQQIERYCRSARVDDAARARLLAIVSEAISHAHSLGVCHGRLGPGSVIVTAVDRPEPLPIVVGFGLFPGDTPPFEADAAGLEAIARAIGLEPHRRPTNPQNL